MGPMTDRTEKSPSAGAPRSLSDSCGRTILLVEDDDDVRQVTGVLLGGLGYRILEAARASAALAVLEAERNIDLMLTDIIMRAR
ncbi:MAG: response regulator [Pseudomonadota bacterium]